MQRQANEAAAQAGGAVGGTLTPEASPSEAPGLARALEVLLPGPTESQLLRACLHAGDPGREAWRRWKEAVGEPRRPFEDDVSGIKGLLPLLQEGLARNGVEEDAAFETYLRAGRLREQLRYDIYRRICGEILTALAAEGIAAIGLKGCALMESVYPDPAIRHSHGIDFLVATEDLRRAAARVAGPDFTLSEADSRPDLGRLVLRHRTGLPLTLQDRLFRLPHYAAPLEAIRARSLPCTIADVPARILAPEDNLLQVCGNAACDPARVNLRWACDAWFLLERNPGFDWERFAATAEASRLALPLSVILGYLARDLALPIPEPTLARLRARATEAAPLDREAALFGALTGIRSGLRALISLAPDWRTRLAVLRFALLPAPAALRWGFAGRLPLPLLYLYRPLRYLASRAYLRLRARLAPPA